MKRTIHSILFVVCLVSLGIWMGRTSIRYFPDNTQLREEMNQAATQAAGLKQMKANIGRETYQRITADPLHRYGGKPDVAEK